MTTQWTSGALPKPQHKAYLAVVIDIESSPPQMLYAHCLSSPHPTQTHTRVHLIIAEHEAVDFDTARRELIAQSKHGPDGWIWKLPRGVL